MDTNAQWRQTTKTFLYSTQQSKNAWYGHLPRAQGGYGINMREVNSLLNSRKQAALGNQSASDVWNEIKVDPESRQKVDGTLIKKFCSGGDIIKARKLRQDSVPLKLQSRLLMMANDFPECSPSDCLEKVVHFDYPCKFVEKSDPRVNTTIYREKDDSLKAWVEQDYVCDAIIHIFLDAYGPSELSDTLKAMRSEFTSETSSDQDRFLEMFVITGNSSDFAVSSEIKARVRQANLGCTSHAYNRWLRAANPLIKTNVGRKVDGKSVKGVAGARLKEGADFYNHDGTHKRAAEKTIEAPKTKVARLDPKLVAMAAGGPPV